MTTIAHMILPTCEYVVGEIGGYHIEGYLPTDGIHTQSIHRSIHMVIIPIRNYIVGEIHRHGGEIYKGN